MQLNALFVLFAVLLAVTAAAHPRWNELNDQYTFDRYLKDFGKVYSEPLEWKKRQQLFAAGLQDILQHNNAHPPHSWKKGLTQFTDWSVEEKKSYGGFKQPRPEDAPRPLRVHEAPKEPFVAPESLDYRLHEPAILTSIKNQGNCADCWAHSATEGIESFFALKTGELHVLSQQQLTSCTNMSSCTPAGYGGCFGGSPHVAVEQVAKYGGIHSNWQYPFTDWFTGSKKTSACRLPQDNDQMMAPQVTTTGHIQIPTNDPEAMLHALVTQGPIAIGVASLLWYDYEGGIFSNPTNSTQNKYFPYRFMLDHAVQLVGYGYDFGLEKHYWIVRNSWGAAWGEDGFIRLERFTNKTQEPCGWDVNQFFNCAQNKTTPQLVCGTSTIYASGMYPEVQSTAPRN